MEQPTVRYQNAFMDSARWDEVALRDGDIVISTPPKCGTTWTQMICALLIFQTPDLPRSLDEMSPWVDLITNSRAWLRAEYESQSHRRFIKTHTPLDGLPFDDRVTYICVGRDPRDAAISWDNHVSNTNFEAIMEFRQAAAAADGRPEESADDIVVEPPPGSATDRFWAWVEDPEPMVGLTWVMRHLASFWRARHLPNVLLLHYDDLKEDLAGQMRALAARLGIEVPEQRWPELVAAAGFDWMRSRADTHAPEKRIWHDPYKFFHRGTSGQWRDLLDPAELPRYAARAHELADPELVTWLHRGRIAG